MGKAGFPGRRHDIINPDILVRPSIQTNGVKIFLNQTINELFPGLVLVDMATAVYLPPAKTDNIVLWNVSHDHCPIQSESIHPHWSLGMNDNFWDFNPGMNTMAIPNRMDYFHNLGRRIFPPPFCFLQKTFSTFPPFSLCL